MKKLLRDPLVHFLVLGGALFALISLEAPPSEAVTIDATQKQLLERQFQRRTGRPPSEAELADEVQTWLDEEVLFQRALELRLHERDPMVRHRLAQRMRFLVEDAEAVGDPSEEQVRRRAADRADERTLPKRWTFEHHFFSRGGRGERLRADAETALAQLAAPSADLDVVDSDPFFEGARHERRTRASIAKMFGARFADALTSVEPGGWHGPIESSFGLHLVRVSDVEEGRPEPRERAEAKVAVALRQEVRERANREALDELRARYSVPPRGEP